jgi:outer membrane protein TolC
LALLALIFATEYAVMLVLPWLLPQHASRLLESAVDAVALTAVLAPVLSWTLVRPLRGVIRLRTQFLADLFTQIESDRKQTAMELHDGVGQALTLLNSGLRSAKICRATVECAGRVDTFHLAFTHNPLSARRPDAHPRVKLAKRLVKPRVFVIRQARCRQTIKETCAKKGLCHAALGWTCLRGLSMAPVLPNRRAIPANAAAWLFVLGSFLLAACAPAQTPKLPQLGAPQIMETHSPQSSGDVLLAERMPFGAQDLLPIDLATALRLAGTDNLDIARAREVVTQSRIQLQRAHLLLLPNVGIGSTYFKHEGKVAKTEGNIITANKDALFVGGGPSLSVNLADAIFAPLVARQTNSATQAGVRRVHSDTLLAVSEAYFAVLRARRRLARVDLALEYLTSDQASPLRAGSRGLLPVVDAMQKAGVAEALKSEVYRVQVEVLRRREERTAAQQEFRVAVAELARLLRLDPATPLWPIEDFRFPMEWQSPWSNQPLDEQVRAALMNRPELAENQFLVQAAVERVRAARYRPLVPNLIVNYAWGDFGGGPDPNPKGGGFGPSGRLLHFGTRSDFDVTLAWRLQNLGFGNRAEIREQESLVRQANLRQLQIQDQVVTQVVQTNELVNAWRERVAITQSALFDKAGKPGGPVFEALRQNFTRIREEPKTRPLEVLDSIRGLSDSLEAYGQALTDYERSRFRLMIALGLAPEDILSAFSDRMAPRER